MDWLEKAYDMVPQSWIINCLKMYKISDEIIKCSEKIMETCRVELASGENSLPEVKIKRGIIQSDALLQLLFVIVMMPLHHILRKCPSGYKLSKSQEKPSPNIRGRYQTVYQKRKRIVNPNMQWEYTVVSLDGSWHRKMHHANNEKRKTTHDARNGITKSRKVRTLGEKETYKVFGILEADSIKQVDIKKKGKNKYSGNRNVTWNQTT